MNNPVVIFGAGASYDCVPEGEENDSRYRPPMSAGLFNPKGLGYADIIEKYKEIKTLVSDVAHNVPNRKTLEQFLFEVRGKASSNQFRQKQLIATIFYLHELFRFISKSFSGQPINNYRSLISCINDNSGSGVFATFNYDLLIEDCIEGLTDEVSSLVEGPIKLVKLHGSCDWGYPFKKSLQPQVKGSPGSYEYLMEDPGFLNQSGNFSSNLNVFPLRVDGYFSAKHDQALHLLPAIAIPVPIKDRFICPPGHLAILKEAIQQTDRILIIGWKAEDENFVKFLSDNTDNTTTFTIVSSEKSSAEKICKKLQQTVQANFVASECEGFTHFVRTGECEKYFSNPA